MRISKKVLAGVLAALMAISMMPFTALASDLPTADISVVTNDAVNTEGLDVAYKFSANNDGTDYYGYNADFIVSVDKAGLSTDDFELYGNYGGYGWTCATQGEYFPYDANYDYYLLKTVLGSDITYEEICTIVKDFYCGVKVNNAENAKGATLTVKLVIYKGDSAPITIGDVMTYTIGEEAPAALPTATIEAISVENLETAYKFSADTTDTNSAYADYKADFAVSFDAAIDAGDVVLSGQYGSYDWTDINLPALAADEDYRLLANNGMGDVTYNDVVTLVKEFNCGAVGVNAEGVTMTVKFNIYDANDNAYTIVSKSYTFASDKMSITVEDKVDLNVYVAENVSIENLRITYNATPELEENNQTSDIVDYDSLPDTAEGKKVNIELAPAQIMDNIKIEALDDQGEVVKTIETSVADYCKAVMNDNSMNPAVKELAKATLDYGKAASDYFNYNTSGFAGYANQLGEFSTSGYSFEAFVEGLNISSVSYRATSVPELRFVVTNITEAQAAELNKTIEINGIDEAEASFAKLSDGTIILQVTNIPIAKFDQSFEVLANGCSLVYTPLTWVKVAKTVPALADLANAIGNQFAASKAVF